MRHLSRYYKGWFIRLWNANANRYKFRDLAQRIMPSLTDAEFDRGWDARLVLHENKPQAILEFEMVINRIGYT